MWPQMYSALSNSAPIRCWASPLARRWRLRLRASCRAQAQQASFTQVRSFNLDEYWGVGPDHPRSYAQDMRAHLFAPPDHRTDSNAASKWRASPGPNQAPPITRTP